MNIIEMINHLNSFKNKSAKVIITIGDEDNDDLSTSDFEILSDTSETHEYVEIFINKDTCSKQM